MPSKSLKNRLTDYRCNALYPHYAHYAHYALTCVAAIPNGLMVEVFTPHDDGYYGHEIDPPRLPNELGNIAVPGGPGLRIELDEDYIEAHLTD